MADLLLSKRELKAKFSRKYDYKRAKCKDPKIIKGWFSLVRNTVAKYRILEQDIYNFNEVGFTMGVITTTKVVTSLEAKSRPKTIQPRNREAEYQERILGYRASSVQATDCPLLLESMLKDSNSSYKHIKNYIVRHQNSSPTLINDAVSCLVKGAEMMMHSAVLLKAEVKALQAANEQKKRRERKRKRRIMQGGSLSVREGEDILQSAKVDAQLRTEVASETTQQVGSTGRQRRCGTCGNMGHNAPRSGFGVPALASYVWLGLAVLLLAPKPAGNSN
ncbi:hypothetical protein V499_02324 [Pseudogymnoascus sp. VKM F-103]|nr:hypothetical protein V499_02324 [Pseudogymnoascus sp. VKM F-103]